MAEIIHELTDLTYLDWTRSRHSSGTAGSFLKSQEISGGRKIYYKLSNYDPLKGIVGHECVNEIIADRLLTAFGIEHLEYTLIHAKIKIDGKEVITYLCSSYDFKQRDESKLALDVYYQMERLDGELPLDFCLRLGWDRYIYDMLLLDYLILNRDRHGANIEILRNARTGSVRPAPLFDHGLSLLFSCKTDAEVLAYDVMEDKPVQCFVGGISAERNLELISHDRKKTLPEYDADLKDLLFEGMDAVISTVMKDQMWQMIKSRMEYYEDFCNQR